MKVALGGRSWSIAGADGNTRDCLLAGLHDGQLESDWLDKVHHLV